MLGRGAGLARKGIQLVEEALLLIVALAALSIIVGTIQNVAGQLSKTTGLFFDYIKKIIDGLFAWLNI